MSYNTQETSEFVSQAKSTGPDLIHSFWSALIQTENFGLLRKSVGGTKAIRNIKSRSGLKIPRTLLSRSTVEILISVNF